MSGSFIAALTQRWPAGRSMAGRSACDNCGLQLRWFELVPLFSFLLQLGRCRRCGGGIPLRHLAIEIAAAIVGATALLVAPGPGGWAGAGFGWLLLTLLVLDAEHFWLPDVLTLALTVGGLVAGLWLAPAFVERLWGALAGWASLSAIASVYRWRTGRDGMGGGDPKLLAGIGAWLGWSLLPQVVLVAALFGLLLAGIDHWRGRPVDRLTPLPLGALLAVAAYPVWLCCPDGTGAGFILP